MSRYSPEVLQAMCNLRTNHDFGIVMQAVAGQASDLNERLIKAQNGDEWVRGQVCAYSTFLEDVNTAHEVLTKATRPKT